MERLTKEQLDKTNGQKLSSKNVLSTDFLRAFNTYKTERGIEIQQSKAGGKVRTKTYDTLRLTKFNL